MEKSVMLNKNKKAQGLSTNAIILIVLGVLVLALLIVGFSMGWDKIAPWLKPSNNVKEIVQSCSLSCSTDSKYEFCSLKRKLFATDLPNGIKEKEETCSFFAKTPEYEKYGIEDCPGLCEENTLENPVDSPSTSGSPQN